MEWRFAFRANLSLSILDVDITSGSGNVVVGVRAGREDTSIAAAGDIHSVSGGGVVHAFEEVPPSAKPDCSLWGAPIAPEDVPGTLLN